MHVRQYTRVALAVALLLVERGLDFLGVTSTVAAITLFSISGIVMLSAVWVQLNLGNWLTGLTWPSSTAVLSPSYWFEVRSRRRVFFVVVFIGTTAAFVLALMVEAWILFAWLSSLAAWLLLSLLWEAWNAP